MLNDPKKTKMLNGRTSTTTILLLSIIVLMMMMMIEDCGGWMAACYGSTAAEFQVLVDEEQEFMMDTEEHRRILTGKSGGIAYGTLERNKPPANGKYTPSNGGRKCPLYTRCSR